MFDPERDEDHDSRRFIRRVLLIAMVTVAACAVLYPSVTGFAAGPDHQIGCLAIKDGWDRDHSMSDAQLTAVFSALPKPPSPQQMQDPEVAARWRAEWRAAQASPAVQHAIAAENWSDGPGACVRQSRHRLSLTGIGLGVLLLGCGGVALVSRARRGSRVRAPASDL